VNDQQTYSASLILHPESGKTMRKLLRGASSVRGVQEFRTDLLFAICYLLFTIREALPFRRAQRLPASSLPRCSGQALRRAKRLPASSLPRCSGQALRRAKRLLRAGLSLFTFHVRLLVPSCLCVSIQWCRVPRPRPASAGRQRSMGIVC
jgi:hypothetical protein